MNRLMTGNDFPNRPLRSGLFLFIFLDQLFDSRIGKMPLQIETHSCGTKPISLLFLFQILCPRNTFRTIYFATRFQFMSGMKLKDILDQGEFPCIP
jgi:hypothetical protein